MSSADAPVWLAAGANIQEAEIDGYRWRLQWDSDNSMWSAQVSDERGGWSEIASFADLPDAQAWVMDNPVA